MRKHRRYTLALFSAALAAFAGCESTKPPPSPLCCPTIEDYHRIAEQIATGLTHQLPADYLFVFGPVNTRYTPCFINIELLQDLIAGELTRQKSTLRFSSIRSVLTHEADTTAITAGLAQMNDLEARRESLALLRKNAKEPIGGLLCGRVVSDTTRTANGRSNVNFNFTWTVDDVTSVQIRASVNCVFQKENVRNCNERNHE